MALYYFAFFGMVGCFAPYLTLFYHERGLSGAQIGLLAAIPPAVSLLAQPVWGYLADRTGYPARMLLVQLSMAGALALLVPRVQGFAALAAMMAAFAVAWTPLFPLADAVALMLLGEERARYPQVRLWGSLSFALTAVATSYMYDGHDFARIFPVLTLGALVTALAALPLDHASRGRQTVRAYVRSPWMLARHGPYVAAVAVTFLLQIANSAHGAFFALYLLRIHMPAAELGIPWALAAVVEVPAFALVPRLVARLGRIRLVALSLLLYAVRFLLFSVAGQPWMALAVQAMQGVTFTFFTAGMVVLINTLSPEGLKATGQTVFTGVGFGLAAIVGTSLGGLVVSHAGVFTMYRLAALLALGAFGVFAAAFRKDREVEQRGASEALTM